MIEQLLGITELRQKADLLKDLLKNTKDKIKEEELRIAAVKSSNERIEKNISDIKLRGKAWEKTKGDKLADMAATISALSEINIEQEISNHKHNQTVKELTDAKTVLDNELARTETSFNRSVKKLAELKANLQKAQEGECPACGQSTAHLGTHEEYTADLLEKIVEEQKYHDGIESRINELVIALVEYADIADEADTFYNDLESALEHKHNLDTLAVQYAEKSEETNPYTEQVEQLRCTGLEEISWDYINDLTDLKEHQEFLHKLLTSKDSFIRKRIIDQNISYLNHRLAYYLDKIGLPHDVKFSSDLGVEITEYGRDLDFDNLSRGERNRLILSLSWSFRDIYESLNQPMNLMCIDELIDSGMDTMGVENSLAILKKMNREQNKNIFLISHKEELVGRVNNVLTVIKEGGFTSYNTDTEYVN
jgi:chromosome segregation ATPase